MGQLPLRFTIAGTLVMVLSAGGYLMTTVSRGDHANEDAPSWAGRTGEVRALLDRGEYVEAESRARRLIAELKSSQVVDPAMEAAALELLVEALWRTDKSCDPHTREQAERAVHLRETANPVAEPELARSLTLLGMTLSSCGDYMGARSLFNRALTISERNPGPDDPATAEILKYLAFLDSTAGRYSDAALKFGRALSILNERPAGRDETEVASILNGLAGVEYQIGDYAGARTHWGEALAIREELLGDDHVLVAGILNNLGSLLSEMGDFSTAKPMLERALEIRTHKLPPGHEKIGATTHALAILHHRVGDYDEAEALYRRAWADHSKHDEAHPAIPLILHNLGELQYERGNYESALSYYEKARVIWVRELGPEHPNVGDAYLGLGKASYESGLFTAARSFLERDLDIHEKTIGGEHPKIAETLVVLASVLAATGRSHEAIETALEAEAIGREQQRLAVRALAEREALRYSDVRLRGLDLAISLALQDSTPERGRVIREVWSALIRSRALVLEEMIARRRSAAAAADPDVSRSAARLVNAGRRLSNLRIRGPGSDSPETYRAMLENALREKEAAERELASSSLDYREELMRDDLGFDETRASLESKSALVAFALYKEFKRPEPGVSVPGPPDPQLVAFLLRPGDLAPAAIPLGAMREIDSLIARWSEEIARGALLKADTETSRDSAYRNRGTALRERIWDPIETTLGEAELIHVVPEGALHRVSLAALPMESGGFLVDSGLRFHYLTAERDLVPHSDPGRHGAGLLALGSPDFDDAPAASPGMEPTRASYSVPASTRLSHRPCAEIAAIDFQPLPYTANEVEEIAALWITSAGEQRDGPVDALTGEMASEAAFKSLAKGRRVLHLATHGFSLTGTCTRERRDSRGVGFLDTAINAEPKAKNVATEPLLLSGFALAGANRAGPQSTDEEDGILTAEEIATLDLQGVDLAVLSACDTGLGRVQTGEGVLGMRRAFEVAGVESLITSLWAVSDDATREWMREFYIARLERRSGVTNAVHEADLRILERRRAHHESTHPFFWAAFVAGGR